MAPPKRPWFRFYVEAVSDVKLRRQKPETRWLFVAMLAAARQSPLAGFLMLSDRLPMGWDDLADYAGLTRKQVEVGTDALTDVGVVGFDDNLGAWFITKWDERQFESDDSTERVTRHRKANDVTANRSPSNGDTPNDVTPPEDREQKTETEGERVPAHHGLLRADSPPDLLSELDQDIAGYVTIYGGDKVDASVLALLGQNFRARYPSKVRVALEALLGPPDLVPKPSPLDDTAAAARVLEQQGVAYTETIKALPRDPDAASKLRAIRKQTLHGEAKESA